MPEEPEGQTFEKIYEEAGGTSLPAEPQAPELEEQAKEPQASPSDAPATKAELEKLYRDLNKGLQKALRENAELRKQLEQARIDQTESIGESQDYEDPIEAIRKELAELKRHFAGAAQMTAQQQAERQARKLGEEIANRVGQLYGVPITIDELWEATQERRFPRPETFEELETIFELVAKDLAVQKKTGKPQTKAAPTVLKSSGAAAKAVKPTLPDVADMDFEDIYRHYQQTLQE